MGVFMEKKKRTRIILIIIALIALGVIGWCAWFLVQYYDGNAFGETLDNYIDKVQIERGTKTVDIPVDFDALHELNPDIYAWVEIPDTDISYPILQREEITPTTCAETKAEPTTAAAASSQRTITSAISATA